jgi:DNA-binding NarL/FixJ family response regulator
MPVETQPASIRVLLVDDHEVIRKGIRAILESAPDFDVVGEAPEGGSALKMVADLQPDVLLLDLKMPGLPSYQVEKWVRQHYPRVVTLILTAHDRDFYLAGMMAAGASGYLSKSERAEKLIEAIRRAVRGEVLFTDEQYQRVRHWNQQAGRKWKNLTNRERQTLELLVQGMDNALIAEHLDVTERTAAYHVSNIIRKLGVTSRQEAISWTIKHIPDLTEDL